MMKLHEYEMKVFTSDGWSVSFNFPNQVSTDYSHLSDKSRVHSYPKSLPFSGQASLKSEPDIQF